MIERPNLKSDIKACTLCGADIKFADESQAFLGFVCSFVFIVLIMSFYFKLHLQSKFPPKEQ